MATNSLKILAIDDNQDNLTSLKAVLRDVLPEAHALTALNGLKGIELALDEDPDVILLDIVMPDMDGFEVCRRLKQDERTRAIPVLFLTALRTDPSSRVKALESGGEGFLTKPIDETELTAQIRAMKKIKEAHELRRQEQNRLVALVAERTRELERSRTAALNLLQDLKAENDARKESEEALRQSETAYRELVENLKDVVFQIDLNGLLTYVSPRVEALIEYLPFEVVGRLFDSLVHPEDLDELSRSFHDVLAGNPYSSDFRVRTKSGELRWVRSSSRPVIRDGTVMGIQGIITDITERRQAEEALRASEIKYRSLFEQMASCVAVYRAVNEGDDFIFVDFNKAAEHTEQISREQVIGRGARDVFPGLVEFGLLDLFRRVWITGNPERHPVALYKDERIQGWRDNFVYKLPTDEIVAVYTDESERRRAELALERSESFQRAIIAASPVALYSIDMLGNVLSWNESAERTFGWKSYEVLGQPLPIVPDDMQLELRQLRERVTAGETLLNLELLRQKRDGTLFECSVSLAPISNDSDEIIGIMGALMDISERKKAEAALIESEQRFRDVFESANVGKSITTLTGRINANKAFSDMLGYTPEEMADRNWRDLTPADEIDGIQGILDTLLCGEKNSARFNKRYLHNNGSLIWADVSITLKRDKDHNPLYFITTIADISEQKRMEEALRSSEERFKILADGAFEGIVISRNGRIVDCNEVLCGMSGYSQEELLGANVLDLVTPEFREMALQHILTGSEAAYEAAFTHKQGHPVPIQVKGKVIPYGGTEARIAAIRDMSAVRKAEEIQKRLATAIEQAAEGILITDSKGTIQYANPAVERTTGYAREELIGRTPRMLRSGAHDQVFYKTLWDTITSGRIWSGKFVNRRKDGTLLHEEATISPVRDATGAISNFVAVKRDITENLELSRQLVQAQKMEAIGTLAGGIAHDFNNVLQVALRYSEIMLDDEELPERGRMDLQKIHDSARRGADLVQRLLTFSRKTEINPQPIDLNVRITELRKMLERTLPKMVDIQLIQDVKLAKINADKTQIDQVLMNLAVNARDAMPDGGKLIFETANVTLDGEYVRMHLDARSGHYVLLMVTDTGSGMDHETLEHIFEPFYTTKGVGEGTGLGLAMVHGIVKQHNGHIICYSEPGAGTSFKIYFPALISDEENEEMRAKSLPRGGSETILLVDDEELIRDLGSRILTKAGYSVITASNGREALEVYRERSQDIALVILDVIMPEMGGRQCLEALMSLNPSLKVVVASGFSANGSTRDTLAAGAKEFVNKPYDIRQVLEVVRSVLDTESG